MHFGNLLCFWNFYFLKSPRIQTLKSPSSGPTVLFPAPSHIINLSFFFLWPLTDLLSFSVALLYYLTCHLIIYIKHILIEKLSLWFSLSSNCILQKLNTVLWTYHSSCCLFLGECWLLCRSPFIFYSMSKSKVPSWKRQPYSVSSPGNSILTIQRALTLHYSVPLNTAF